MRDITPRSMNDIIVPQNGIIRRPKAVPELRPVNAVAVETEKEQGRIEKNPFFEKRTNQTVRPKDSHQGEPVNSRLERRPAEPQDLGKASSGRATKSADSHTILWFFVVLILLGIGFATANYFSSATIEITPVTRSATMNRDFSATKEGSPNDLTFQFMSLTEEKTKEIPATIEKKTQRKASGKVVIFNAYNSEKRRLIKNTRLESVDHKIFRIDESVVVPGAQIVGGKVKEPGSVEATVSADVPGKEYNIGLADFTFPGFKGDPRYTKFSARSKADSPITGGFVGVIKTPSGEAVLAAQEELKQDLKKIAVEKARAQIPDGVSFFPGSMILKFEEVPQEFTTADTAKVLMRATVSVFFFNTTLLVQKLVEASLPEYQGSLFLVPNMSALTFSFIDPVDNVVLSDLTKIRFHLAGDAVFVGKVDEQKIRAALAGKDKKDFGKIVVGEQNVGKAEAVIRPMWRTVFPEDPTKITIKFLDK